MSFLATIGRTTLALLARVGRITLFALAVLRACVTPPFYGRALLQTVWSAGYLSLPLVGLTALFAGGALALQIFDGGSRFSAEEAMPQIVAIGMVRELGPVLVGLMIAARVTSSFAAEIGTMRVTEQIDALITLSTDPMRYLIVPRVLGLAIAAPVLVAVGDIVGIFGGFAVATTRLDFNASVYLNNTVDFLEHVDILSSLVKGAVFGLIAGLMGCYFGMTAGRGAAGVGQATKSAVVAASILILAANFLLTEAFFSG